jgi:hypothetical protein
MLQFPGCPENVSDLGHLIEIFNSELDYDIDPTEYRRNYENRTKSRPDEFRQLFAISHTNPNEYQEGFEVLQKWGRNSNEARRHIAIHFSSGCEKCSGLYRKLVDEFAEDLADMDKVDIKKNPERLEEYRLRADDQLLGLLPRPEEKIDLFGGNN